MHRIPEHLKPVQTRRERLALAVLGGAEFSWRWCDGRGEYQPKRWFIDYLPVKNYMNGPYETKWEAVEAALRYLEHHEHVQPRSQTHTAANA